MKNDIFVRFKENISIKELINYLNKLGKVEDINLYFNKPEDEIYLLKNLPDLEFFNGKKIIKLNKNWNKTNKNSINNNTTKNKIKLTEGLNNYDYLKDIIKFLIKNYKINLKFDDFENFYNKIDNLFKESISKSDDKYTKKSLNILATFEYFNYINNYVLEILRKIDFNLYSIINSINKYITNNFFDFMKDILDWDEYIYNIKNKVKEDNCTFINKTNKLIKTSQLLNIENLELKKNWSEINKNYKSNQELLINKINYLENDNNQNLKDFIKINHLNYKKIYNSSTNLKNKFYFKKINKKDLKLIIKDIYNYRFKDNSKKYWSFKDFILNYFKIKYGNDYLNWYNLIYNNLILYYKNDNYLYLFKVILDNEVDENFYFLISDYIEKINCILNKKYKTTKIITKKEHEFILKELKIKTKLNVNNLDANEYIFLIIRNLINEQIISWKKIVNKLRLFDENKKNYLFKEEFINLIKYLNLETKYQINYKDIISKTNYKNKNYFSFNTIIQYFINNNFNFCLI